MRKGKSFLKFDEQLMELLSFVCVSCVMLFLKVREPFQQSNPITLAKQAPEKILRKKHKQFFRNFATLFIQRHGNYCTQSYEHLIHFACGKLLLYPEQMAAQM